MNYFNRLRKILTCVLLISFSFTADIQTVNARTPENALAIKGYDPVAYFKDSKAKKGSADYSIQWHGMTWYFSNKENMQLFAADAKKYAPQYDGYCAWAMAESRKAVTDPEVWKIYNGKLYLNCSSSAYEKWSRDIPGNIKKADANWEKFHGR